VTTQLPSTKRSLPIALIRARESLMTPIRAMLAESGLTEQQWRVLRVLSEFGPLDATEVSERVCLLLPSLTRIVRTMCEGGLILRERDKIDKRRQTLSLTDAGQALIEENNPIATQIVEEFKDRLGVEDYELLLDLLEKVARKEGH